MSTDVHPVDEVLPKAIVQQAHLISEDEALGVGVVSYAMIQTTGDSGSGARLGSFESRVYGVGPVVSFTTSADPYKALTVLVKWYSEFDAEHTFEGNTVDVAASFKF